MKKLFILFLLSTMGILAFGQDIIYKYNPRERIWDMVKKVRVSGDTLFIGLDTIFIKSTEELQPSLVGNYYNFPGTNDYVQPASIFTYIPEEVSISIRFRKGLNGTLQYLYDSDGGELDILLQADNTVRAQFQGGFSHAVTSTNTITDTDWHIVTATFDFDDDISLYLDGRLWGQTSLSVDPLATVVTDNFIGIKNDLTGDFKGDISHVLVFNIELTPEKVLEISNWSSDIPPVWVNSSNTSELITNGTFTGSSAGWTLTGGVSYGTDDMDFDGTSSTLRQTFGNIVGGRYKVSIEITVRNSGTLRYQIGSTGTVSNVPTSVGTHVSLYTATSTGGLYINPANFDGTIDNVSVEFTGCVANYNSSAMGVSLWYDNSGNGLDGVITGLVQRTNNNTVLDSLYVNLITLKDGATIIDKNGGVFMGFEAGLNSVGDSVNGIGYYVLRDNTGSYSNGFGTRVLENNTGDYASGLGYHALRNNKGDYSDGIGWEAMFYNTGNYSVAFGFGSSYQNTGDKTAVVGSASMQYNDGDKNSSLGDAAFNAFTEDGGSAQTFASTKVNTTTEYIAIAAHGFGGVGTYWNLKWTATTGTLPGGISLNIIDQFEVIHADTIRLITKNMTTQGTGNHTLTPQVVYTNSTAIGYNAEPDASNQIMLGDGSVSTVKTVAGYEGATLNTGQGDNELYAMNQDVESTDAVDFITVNTGEGDNELFGMDQNVTTSSDVEFDSVEVNQITKRGDSIYSAPEINIKFSDISFGESYIDNYRSTVLDDGGTYYPNNGAYQYGRLKSFGIDWKASYMMLASAVKADELYVVKGSTNLTVVRNSLATRVTSNGKLEEVAVDIARIDYTDGDAALLLELERENLITYPISFGNSYWTKSGATIGADATTKGADQNVSNCVDGDYTTFGGAAPTGFAATSNGGATHEAGTDDEIIVTTSNIIRVAFTLTLNSGTAPTVALKAALAGANIANAKTQVSTAGANVMYFFGSVATTGVAEFSNTSTATDFVIADLSVSAVTGYPAPHTSVTLGVCAFKLIESVSGAGSIQQFIRSANLTVTSGVDYTYSFYAKKAENTWIAGYITIGGAGNLFYFDLDNGVLGTVDPDVTATITALANGWYRCTGTVTTTNTGLSGGMFLADADNSDTFTGDGGSGVYIAFAQVELGSYPTSFVYSIAAGEGATYTRVADQCNNGGGAADFNSVEGVLYMESATLFDDGTDRYVSNSDGTTDNAIQLYYSSTINQIVGKIIVGTVTQATLTYTLTDETDFAKSAFRYKVNDFSLWVNGVERDTDASGVSFSYGTLTEQSFDDGAGANDGYGKWRSVISLDFLSDFEIANLTAQ